MPNVLQVLTPDLTFALLLAGVAVVVFFAVRVGALPRKSAPLVIGGLLGAIGIAVWRERRARDTHKALKQQYEAARRRDDQLKELKKQYELSDQDVSAAIAKRNAEVDSLVQDIVQLRKHHADEAERIAGMTPDQRRDYVLNMKF